MPDRPRKRLRLPLPGEGDYDDQPRDDFCAGPIEPNPEFDASVRATRARLFKSADATSTAPASSATSGLAVATRAMMSELASGVRAAARACAAKPSSLRPMAKGKPNTRIVSPGPNGGWDVRAPNASRASAHERTQAAADKRAAQILRNQGGGERITQGRDGRIRSKDTIAPARDPIPPRDREH